jgi:hypothetical protein
VPIGATVAYGSLSKAAVLVSAALGFLTIGITDALVVGKWRNYAKHFTNIDPDAPSAMDRIVASSTAASACGRPRRHCQPGRQNPARLIRDADDVVGYTKIAMRTSTASTSQRGRVLSHRRRRAGWESVAGCWLSSAVGSGPCLSHQWEFGRVRFQLERRP